jgi:hypothetical protein
MWMNLFLIAVALLPLALQVASRGQTLAMEPKTAHPVRDRSDSRPFERFGPRL